MNAYDFLAAIESGISIDWQRFVQTMRKAGVEPGAIKRMLEPASNYAKKTTVQIIDQQAFDNLKQLYLPTLVVSDRISAALAGDSHQVAVAGSMLVIQHSSWQHPQVALSRDGTHWQPSPDSEQHLVIIENMQNFLHLESSLQFIIQQCQVNVPRHAIMLAYGAGNAASKACHANYYRQFTAIHCLFDIDLGGVQIYAALKQLLGDSVPVNFLVPHDIEQRLQQSRRALSNDELAELHKVHAKHPELHGVLQLMYQTKKKLEQESYLEPMHE